MEAEGRYFSIRYNCSFVTYFNVQSVLAQDDFEDCLDGSSHSFSPDIMPLSVVHIAMACLSANLSISDSLARFYFS